MIMVGRGRTFVWRAAWKNNLHVLMCKQHELRFLQGSSGRFPKWSALSALQTLFT